MIGSLGFVELAFLFVVMAVFAFAEWPATRELHWLKRLEKACTCQPERTSVFPYPGT